MRKALLALAGLFFLLLAYSSFPSTAGSASSPASGWKEIRVSNVDPGRSYRVDGCLTVVSGGVDYVALRLAWHDGLNGYGVQLSDEDATGAASLIGAEQCLSLTDTAPCRSRSALYGVVVSGDGDAVEVDSASLDLTALATTKPCPTPTATPVATATPTSGDKPKEPTAKPEGQATTTTPTPEPLVYPALVNGSFEQARADGTPQAWRKFGGEMRRTSAAVHEGKYAASLRSTTESTKWLYQAVTVKGGHAYRLSAFALKDDPDLAEVYLRISWYESDDATGTATNTTDSTERLTADSGSFRRLTTGAAVAPAEARSAKVRLMMRPRSAAAARAYFDAVTFEETSPPAGTAATAAPAAGALGSSDDGSVASSTYASPAPTAALGTEDRPVTLVNVHSGAPEGSPLEGGGRGLDPLVLGLGIGIPLTAAAGGGAYWWARRRLAWGRKAPL